jgi:hypothetical protein
MTTHKPPNEQAAGTNRRRRFQFRFADHVFWSRVAVLWTLDRTPCT